MEYKKHPFIEALRTISESSHFEPQNLSEELQQLLLQSLDKLTIPTDLTGYEASLTGSKLAYWIKPLHFEDNINGAIDALESMEALQRELRNYLITRLLINFADQYFSKNKGKNDVYLNAFKENGPELLLTDNLDILHLRYTSRFSDLVELTKAAKLGAFKLMGILPESLEYTQSANGISRIRESLRILLQQYKSFTKKDEEIIIPVSLKKARDLDGRWLVTRWAADNMDNDTDNARGESLSLGQRQLNFNLLAFPKFQQLQHTRIRRIGIQVIDAESTTLNSMAHPNTWNCTLEYPESIDLGSEDNLYRIPLLSFHSIAGRNPNAIAWNGNDAVYNARPNCWWILVVAPTSNLGTPFTSIRDIIVHFHITHNTR